MQNETNAQPLTATVEQIDAVNRRLDAYERDQRRARNRQNAMHSTPHMDPPPVFVNRTLAPELAGAGIDAEALKDSVVSGHLDAVRSTAKDVQEDLAWLQQAARSFSEMTASLLTPGDTPQRLLAAAFAGEADTFASKISRITKRVEQLDGEAAALERQEQMHARLARASLQTNMAPHVASEVRQWLRSMPSDSDRVSALRGAIQAGDRELVHAVTEVGVPPMMLGFKDRATFDELVSMAERRFGAEHVHRRESCRVLKERTMKLRNHLHNSSEATCALGMLERWPQLAKIVAEARLK